MQDATAGTATTAGGGVATDETDRLIASNKVDGTAVYNRQGERLGSVYNFMVDKRSGQVEYAVMSFGGFLGIGDSYHPLPWKSLKYDTCHGRLCGRPRQGSAAGGAKLRQPVMTPTGATRATAAGSTTTTAPSRAPSPSKVREGLLRPDVRVPARRARGRDDRHGGSTAGIRRGLDHVRVDAWIGRGDQCPTSTWIADLWECQFRAW